VFIRRPDRSIDQLAHEAAVAWRDSVNRTYHNQSAVTFQRVAAFRFT
jgi:hypothetical protein